MEALVLIWFLYMYSVQFAWAKGSLSVYHWNDRIISNWLAFTMIGAQTNTCICRPRAVVVLPRQSPSHRRQIFIWVAQPPPDAKIACISLHPSPTYFFNILLFFFSFLVLMQVVGTWTWFSHALLLLRLCYFIAADKTNKPTLATKYSTTGPIQGDSYILESLSRPESSSLSVRIA